jgi:hypothetical protein
MIQPSPPAILSESRRGHRLVRTFLVRLDLSLPVLAKERLIRRGEAGTRARHAGAAADIRRARHGTVITGATTATVQGLIDAELTILGSKQFRIAYRCAVRDGRGPLSHDRPQMAIERRQL